MPEAAGMQLLFQIRNSPNALALGARELLTTTRCNEPVPPVSDLGDLSIDYIIVGTTGPHAVEIV
jgi:hypothetical protein